LILLELQNLVMEHVKVTLYLLWLVGAHEFKSKSNT